MKFLILFSAFIFQTAFAEVVEFKLQTEEQVCKGLAQVVISQDKKILYHFEAPMFGTAQAHLLTGNYQVDVTNKEGCTFQNVLQVTETQNKLIELKLKKAKREVANGFSLETSSGYRPQYMGSYWPSPWWGGWGYNMYNTSFYSPCMWGTYGCGGGYYPHSGSIAMGKPNIYFSGKKEGKFKLKFSGENFNFLATVPTFKDKDLVGELRDGSVYADNVRYPYVFYDARVYDEHLQNNQGFCGNRKEIFNFMIEGLRKYQFPDTAVHDFGDYWSVKIPEALKYCVFPQVNAQLDKVAPLEITFDDKSSVRTERLFYLVIPQDYKGKRIPAKSGKFSDRPTKSWTHYTRTVIPKTPYLYEWGVGFIFE